MEARRSEASPIELGGSEEGSEDGDELATVAEIVTALRGALIVAEELELGSRFEVCLPVRRADEMVGSGEEEPLPGGSERVLCVDDEAQGLELLQQVLEGIGYRVTAVTSSAEALELVRARPHDFDLLLTDQTMPGLTGDMLVEEVLKLRPDMPTVLCTGFGDQVGADRASACGVRCVLGKPVRVAVLAQTVREVLDG